MSVAKEMGSRNEARGAGRTLRHQKLEHLKGPRVVATPDLVAAGLGVLPTCY
jgi:hypothetical protein